MKRRPAGESGARANDLMSKSHNAAPTMLIRLHLIGYGTPYRLDLVHAMTAILSYQVDRVAIG